MQIFSQAAQVFNHLDIIALFALYCIAPLLLAASDAQIVLIVAVNTDESLKRIKPNKVIAQSYEERIAVVAGFEAVDYTIPLHEDTPEYLISLFKPDIHTKGTDYTLDTLPEREIIESYGGRIMFVGGDKDRSTTKILERIVFEQKRLAYNKL